MQRVSGYRVLPRTRAGALASIEREFVAERASALGRAGQRLADAIAAWEQLHAAGDGSEDERQDALDELVEATYALMVQRECAGFRIGNVRWIRSCYDIPDVVLRHV